MAAEGLPLLATRKLLNKGGLQPRALTKYAAGFLKISHPSIRPVSAQRVEDEAQHFDPLTVIFSSSSSLNTFLCPDLYTRAI